MIASERCAKRTGEAHLIRLRVLGPVELQGSDGRELRTILAQPKRLALLAYLAAGPGFQRRDTLLALFWPEADMPRARLALNQAIRFLRRELGSAAIVSRGAEEVGVDAAALWCDAAAFREAVEAARHGEALELYRGHLLDGFFVAEARGFEDWLEHERARLRTAAARSARLLAEQREREQHFTTAVSCARRAAELSDLDERMVRQLIALLDRLGDRAGAIHAYETFAQRLAAEYGAEPSPETRALVERVRAREEPRPAERAGRVIRDAVGEAESAAGKRMIGAAEAMLLPSAGHPVALPGYEVEREIGRGGMATVYRARDLKHDRPVAVKTLRPELALSLGPERFLREIEITARLAHPHILPLLDSGSSDGTLYYVMPYVTGESLRARLTRERRLGVDEALRIAREVADALDYAHRQGIVHRDIKPENVLLEDATRSWRTLASRAQLPPRPTRRRPVTAQS